MCEQEQKKVERIAEREAKQKERKAKAKEAEKKRAKEEKRRAKEAKKKEKADKEEAERLRKVCCFRRNVVLQYLQRENSRSWCNPILSFTS